MVSGVRIHNVNHDFFKKWSPNMAYILGFTCADGCVYERSLSWELSNKVESEKILLEKFSKELGSTYEVEEKTKSFRLRINSFSMVNDIIAMGITQNKSKTIKFPFVPKEYLRHFIRGLLDGDGWISMRNKRKSNEITLGFVGGSKFFMRELLKAIEFETNIKSNLRVRKKISKKGFLSVYYKVDFYQANAYKIIKYLYDDLTENDLFLLRKNEKQIMARKLFEESQRRVKLGKKWVMRERERSVDILEELTRMFAQEKMLPIKIASKLNVSLSTIYRWIEKSGLRIMVKRGSDEWTKRILTSRNNALYAKQR